MLAVAAKTRMYPVFLPDRDRPERRARLLKRTRGTPLTGALAAAVILMLPAILYVAQSTAVARTGYAILALRGDVEALAAENARLIVSVSALKSPERIERIARTELGMRKPRPTQLAALTLPAPRLAAAPTNRPTVWQYLSSLLLRQEAAASESP